MKIVIDELPLYPSDCPFFLTMDAHLQVMLVKDIWENTREKFRMNAIN